MIKSIKEDLLFKNYKKIYLTLKNKKSLTDFEKKAFLISKQFFTDSLDEVKKEFLQLIKKDSSEDTLIEYLFFLIRRGSFQEFQELLDKHFLSFKNKGVFLGEVYFELYSFINRFFKSSKDVILFEKLLQKLNSLLFHKLK